MSAEYPLVRNLSAFSTRSGVRTSPSRSGSSPNSASNCRMSSCIRVFYITVFACFLVVPASGQPSTPRAPEGRDPDALYRDRENLASARDAAAIWRTRVQTNAGDFESWWKLARAYYWLGGHGPQETQKNVLEQGIAAAERAIALRADRPEGYF